MQDSAVRASKEGADLVIIDVRGSESAEDIIATIRPQISVPMLAYVDGNVASGPQTLLASGSDGIALSWEDRNAYAESDFAQLASTVRTEYKGSVRSMSEEVTASPSLSSEDDAPCALTVVLGERVQCMIDSEKEALEEVGSQCVLVLLQLQLFLL